MTYPNRYVKRDNGALVEGIPTLSGGPTFSGQIPALNSLGQFDSSMVAPNVASLNGATGAVTLAGGIGIGISVSGQTITISGSINNGSVGAYFDDGNALAPASGQFLKQEINYDGVIVSAAVYADMSGSCSISVSKASAIAYPTFTAISAASPITLSGQVKNTSPPLTGWTIDFSKGDIFKFSLDLASALTNIIVVLHTMRTD